MLNEALGVVALRAIRAWCFTYSVHVGGYGTAVPTMKPWQMDPVFVLEVWFGLCVDVGEWGASYSVDWVDVMCSVSVIGVYVCAEWCAVRCGWQSSSYWLSFATVLRGGRAFCLRAWALRRWCRGCVGQYVNEYICVPLISMCCLRGSTSVSLWRLGIGVVCVQPVAIRSALFLMTCSFFMCVVAVSGCHARWAYVSTVCTPRWCLVWIDRILCWWLLGGHWDEFLP